MDMNGKPLRTKDLNGTTQARPAARAAAPCCVRATPGRRETWCFGSSLLSCSVSWRANDLSPRRTYQYVRRNRRGLLPPGDNVLRFCTRVGDSREIHFT